MKNFLVLLAAILAAMVAAPAEAQVNCWATPSTCAAFGGWYGYGPYGYGWGVSIGIPPPPPAPPAVVYAPPAPAPAPPAQQLTGRLVVIGSVTPGELFIDGESKGSLQSREVKAFDLQLGTRSVIMKTDKKVLVKTVGLSPSSVSVVNFDP